MLYHLLLPWIPALKSKSSFIITKMMAAVQQAISGSTSHLSICGHCHLLRKVVPSLWTTTRGSRNWKSKVLKREDIKDDLVDYVSKTPRRADRVYSWGCATTGALGVRSYLRPEKNQKTLQHQNRPARVKFIDSNGIQPYFVSCGYGFTVYAVKSRHGLQILGTGINTSSQLGYHEVPRNSGRVLDYIIEPAEIYLPVEKPHATRVRHIGCGRAHTVIITEGEGVFSLGNNAYGQCGRHIVEEENFSKNPLVHMVQELPDDIEKVVCGQDHTIFISATGQLYACGIGADGQTGQGHYDLVSVPSVVGGDVQGERIVQVHGRGDCVLAVSDKGDVFGWGNSEYNQLAMVTDQTQISTPQRLPIHNCGCIIKAVAGGSICALLNEFDDVNSVLLNLVFVSKVSAKIKGLQKRKGDADQGQVFVWGYGILGKGPALESSDVPTMIPETLFGQSELRPDTAVVDIDCGLGHFVAITDEGVLYSWGHNRQGCLGLGFADNQTFPLKVSVPAETHTVLCGVDHTIALCKSFT